MSRPLPLLLLLIGLLFVQKVDAGGSAGSGEGVSGGASVKHAPPHVEPNMDREVEAKLPTHETGLEHAFFNRLPTDEHQRVTGLLKAHPHYRRALNDVFGELRDLLSAIPTGQFADKDWLTVRVDILRGHFGSFRKAIAEMEHAPSQSGDELTSLEAVSNKLYKAVVESDRHPSIGELTGYLKAIIQASARLLDGPAEVVRVGDHQQPLHHQQQPPSCSRRANAFHEWLSEVVETIPAQTLPSGQSESFINGIHQMLSNAFAGACSKGQPKKIGDDDEQQLNASNWHKFIRRRRRGADGFACLIGTCIVIFAIPVIMILVALTVCLSVKFLMLMSLWYPMKVVGVSAAAAAAVAGGRRR